MDKDELLKKRAELAQEYRKVTEAARAEKRSLADDEAAKLDGLKDQIEKVNEEIRAWEKEEERMSYLKDFPVVAPKKKEEGEFRSILEAMRENRAITVSGTGATNVIGEIVKQIQAKKPLLGMARTFYGPNASTNIPIWSPTVANPSYAAEGKTDVASDTTAALGVKALTPYSYISVLPVSSMALKLSGASLETELPTIFGDAFGQAMHAGLLSGAGTTGLMTGLFLDAAIPAANDIDCAASGAPKMADLVGLALKVQDYVDDAVIILNPAIYSAIMGDTTVGTDVYKEELARGKTVEGVKVILTSGAPSATTVGSIVAVAGSMRYYGLAIAESMEIVPIRKPGDANTYFQAEMFFNGAPIIGANFFALKAIA